MTRGCTRKTPTPTPLSAPTSPPATSPRRIATTSPWFARLGRREVGGHRGDLCHGQVDAAGQHDQRLARREDRERGRELDGVRRSRSRRRCPAGPAGAAGSAPRAGSAAGSIGCSRRRRRQSRAGRAAIAARGRHVCCRRRMSQPPTMTTMTMIPPLDDVAVVGVDAEEDQVLADEREDERGGERAEQPALAPREAHAAEHDGGDGGRACSPRGPASRCPSSSSARGRPSPRTARPSTYAATFVRSTWTPLRNAASRSLPTAYSDRPRRERRSGSQTTATTTMRTTSALGRTVDEHAAGRERLNQSRPAAGLGQHQQRRPGPHERHRERHDDVRDARDDDEPAIDEARRPTRAAG